VDERGGEEREERGRDGKGEDILPNQVHGFAGVVATVRERFTERPLGVGELPVHDDGE